VTSLGTSTVVSSEIQGHAAVVTKVTQNQNRLAPGIAGPIPRSEQELQRRFRGRYC
jgi:hypothetical protein